MQPTSLTSRWKKCLNRCFPWGIRKGTHLPAGARGGHVWAKTKSMGGHGEERSSQARRRHSGFWERPRPGLREDIQQMGLEKQAEAKSRRPLWARPRSPAGSGQRRSWPPQNVQGPGQESKWRPTDRDSKLLNKICSACLP